MLKEKIVAILKMEEWTKDYPYIVKDVRTHDSYNPFAIEVTFTKRARFLFASDEYCTSYTYSINKYVQSNKWDAIDHLRVFMTTTVRNTVEESGGLPEPLTMGNAKEPKIHVEHGDKVNSWYALINKTIDRVGLICLCRLQSNGKIEDLNDVTINKPTEDGIWFKLEIHTVANEIKRIIYDGKGSYYYVVNTSKYIVDHYHSVMPQMGGVDRFIIDTLIRKFVLEK